MTHSRERATLQKLISDAKLAGYATRAFRLDAEIMLNIEGGPYNDLFEAYFTQNAGTGYWRWSGGFRHVGTRGDTYRTLKEFRAIVFPEKS